MSDTGVALPRVRAPAGASAIAGRVVLRMVVGVLTTAAGIIHLVHATAHLRPPSALGVGFIVVGWLQVVVGALTAGRDMRRVLATAVVVDVGAVAAWLLSRTVGLPLAGAVEPVGAADGFTAAIAAIAAVAATRLLASRAVGWSAPEGVARVVGWVGAVVVVVATTATLLAGAHLHDRAHHNGHVDAAVAEPGHDIFGHPLDGSHEHDLFPQLDD